MNTGPRAVLRRVVTVLVTVLIVVAEFAFLSAVYHSDDHVDDERLAQTRFGSALATWTPGDASAPLTEGVALMRATGVDGADELSALTDRVLADPSPANLTALRSADRAAAVRVEQAQHDADLRAAWIHALLLVAVSIGWFFWFRGLVRRHRELQRALTERQTVDAGERRLLSLVQNSTDVIAVLEPDATVTFVSPAVETILGHDPAGLLGRRMTEVLHPDDVAIFVHILASSEGEHPVTLGARHADGRDLVLEGTLTNLLSDSAVAGLVLTLRDVTDRHQLQQQLTHQAFHDSLTGLANRQLFRDRLDHALRRRAGKAEPLVVLFLDLDDFKNINDSRGHHVGDEVLLVVAERLRAAIREGDTAARLGGDEFAVLMEAADVDTAEAVVARLLESIAEPIQIEGSTFVTRASVGIAEATPGQSTGDEVLRNADVAMYWAKARGKGTMAVHDESLHLEALQRLEMRSELQTAIRDQQLVLHYQPLVAFGDGRISGFEALVRWQHPERGLLPPLEFIPVAEQSGLVVPLGSWVLRTACAAGASLLAEGHQTTMSVNVAAQQLARDDFAAEVVAVLAETGMRPDRLVLEITESVLLDDLDSAVAALTRLRAEGVRIAIDDFGTGYSSLSYLSRLPVDVLKVDKSFVDTLGGSDQQNSLVEAIVTMSRTMRLVTVAEGVEHQDQATWLRDAECSLGQGYLWSRPVEIGAARDLLGSTFLTAVTPGSAGVRAS